MKVGSIVELINDQNWKYKDQGIDVYPVKGVEYTVRSIITFPNGAGIALEEIVNEPRWFINGYVEVHFAIHRFKELLPPIDMNEIIENLLKEPA